MFTKQNNDFDDERLTVTWIEKEVTFNNILDDFCLKCNTAVWTISTFYLHICLVNTAEF